MLVRIVFVATFKSPWSCDHRWYQDSASNHFSMKCQGWLCAAQGASRLVVGVGGGFAVQYVCR